MKRVATAAALAAVVAPAAAHDGHHRRRACAKLFTVRMARRAADRAWAGLHTPARHDWRALFYFARCQRNPRAQEFVHHLYQRAAQENATRRYAAAHPFSTAYVSWYDDAGQTASGWHTTYGVADCGSGGGPCFPFGTRIEFCLHGCVIATVDDHGPYVAGREFDLNQNTAGAIGFDGVGDVQWRVR